ncbi:MAG: class F sortase [Actinobacteria bacterium]|nr:class F sortase [Actinomycetota bacterium]
MLAVAAILAFLAIVRSGSPPSATVSPPKLAATPSPHSLASARLPPGEPEWITIPAIGVHAAVRSVISTHTQGGWLIVPPMATNPDLWRVYWWREHAAPANPSKGTSYIYGHACSHYALCAFNRLHELAKGDLARVTTVHGTLTYRVVAKPIRLAKNASGIGASSIYNYGVVNRLVLITCAYTPDGSSPWNWVVITQLTAATRAP